MFLSIRTLLTVTLVGFGISAQAKVNTLSAGNYSLVEGEKNLCLNFSLSERDAQAKQISLGGLYSYETVNAARSIESDIDPACEFREQSHRDEQGEVTVLTRVNEEYCKGRLRSRTVSTASIRHDEIQVRHEISGAPAFTCVWKN